MPIRRRWLAPTLMLALVGTQTQGCGLEVVPVALLPAAAAGGLAVGGLGAWLFKPNGSPPTTNPGASPGALASSQPNPIQGGGGTLVHDGGVVFAQGNPATLSTTEGNFTTNEVAEVASLGVASRQIALMLSNTQQDRVPLAPPLGATAEGDTAAVIAAGAGNYRLASYSLAQEPQPPRECTLVFKDFDTNQPLGQLLLDEFKVFMGRHNMPLDKANLVFTEWDSNKDGFIDPAEFCPRLGNLQPPPPGGNVDPACRDGWLRFDTEVKDGFLTLNEFAAGKKATDPSQPSLELVRQEFNRLDGDKNEVLGPVELCAQNQGLPPPPAGGSGTVVAGGALQGPPPADPACLNTFSTDDNPKVSFEEFAKAMTGSATPSGVVAEAIKATFIRLDANSSGDLDAFELCGRGPLAPGAGPAPGRPVGAPPGPVLAQGSGGMLANGGSEGRFTFPGEQGLTQGIVYRGAPPVERLDPQGGARIERSYNVDLFGTANTVVVSRPKEAGAVSELGIRWKPNPQAGEVSIQVKANNAEVSFPGGGKASLSALALSGGALQSQGTLTSAAGASRDVSVGLLADGRTSCTISERRFAVQLLFDPLGRGSGAIVDARGNTLGQLAIGANGKLEIKLSSNGAKGTLDLPQPK